MDRAQLQKFQVKKVIEIASQKFPALTSKTMNKTVNKQKKKQSHQ